jgi:Glucodextranase, domain B/Curli production assembly/transport component CsgG
MAVGRVILGLLLLFCFVGCAVEHAKVYVKDGKQYGVTPWKTWRARWWDFYMRGSSYAAGAFWDEAIADFQAAMQQRHEDQRRARTYGMHLIDYFPHRELGIVFYHLGRHTEAIGELEASLRNVETAKAKFYLNKARQSLLYQTGRDAVAPRIVLDSPSDGLLTNHFSVTVTGHVEDDTYVSAVSVNGQAQFIELAAPHLSFTQEVVLHDGVNSIDLVAEDLVGRQTRQHLTIQLDRHGPLLSLERVDVLSAPPQRRARVQGFLTDHSRIVRFKLGGKAVSLPPATTWEFREDIAIAPGVALLPFEVADAAGNVIRGEITLASPTDGAPGIREGKAVVLPRWASLHPEHVVADLPMGHAVPLQVASRDRHPPVIRLSGLADRDTIFDDTVYLEGQVTDASGITAFAINGESLWRRKAQRLFFGQRFALHEGDNTFLLEAVDESGNTAQHRVVVLRKLQQVKQVGSRLQAVLLPFERKGETSVLAEVVYDYLFNVFVQQRRFDFVERQRLEAILQELKLYEKLRQGVLADPASAAAAGKKIATAEGILVGTVTETPQSLEVFLRFVDVDTAVVLAAEDVYGEDLSLATVKTLVEGLAWKVRRQFPLVEGLVLEKEGKRLLTDLAERHGVRRYMKLIIFRPGQELKHPHTGRLLQRPDTILGEARITAVSADLSEALMLISATPGDGEGVDRVITK